MKKIIDASRKISKFLVILFVIFIVVYFSFLFYFEKLFPLPTAIQIENIYIKTIAVSFFILLSILLVSDFPKTSRIILFFLAIPFCCIFSYILIEFQKKTLQTIQFDNHRYYITVEAEIIKPHTIYKTYMCNTTGLECHLVFSDIGGATIDNVEFILNEKMTELYVLRNGILKYAHGSKSWETVRSIEQGDSIFYIGIYPTYVFPNAQRTYVLYKCKSSLTACEQIPFQYNKFAYFGLKFDENTHELIVYESKYEQTQKTGDVIIFSYGTEPKCFVEGCSIPNQ